MVARSDLARLEAALPPRKLADRGDLLPRIGLRDFAADFCGITYSPLMAAIADASEGVPVTTITDEQCERHFGCLLAALPRHVRRLVAVRAGGRAGKTSRLVAIKAIQAAWTTPLPTLNPGEVAVALLVAPDMKLAKQALSFVKGYVEASATLSKAQTKDATTDYVELRRADGKIVRIEVLAATRGGRGVRARTLVFAALDEAAFFYAEGTGVVNDLDILNAVEQRVVPGGQVWIVSTPWLADTGVLERTLKENWGTHDKALVAEGGTRALNPTWDPTGEIEKALRERDPDAAQREIDGKPLTAGVFAFFEAASIERAVDATLKLPRMPKPGEEVSAGADLGFRSDAAALAIAHRAWIRVPDVDPLTEQVRCDSSGRPMTKALNVCITADLLELQPRGEPLKPSTVIAKFADVMRRHAGLGHFVSDGHYRETATEHLAEHGLGFVLAPQGAEGVAKAYMRARTLLREGRARIPDHPRLIEQLKAIRWQALPGGGISIIKPRVTARADRGGSHCDLADAWVLSVWELGGLSVDAPPPEAGTYEAALAETKAIQRQLEEELEARLREKREAAAQDEYWS